MILRVDSILSTRALSVRYSLSKKFTISLWSPLIFLMPFFMELNSGLTSLRISEASFSLFSRTISLILFKSSLVSMFLIYHEVKNYAKGCMRPIHSLDKLTVP